MKGSWECIQLLLDNGLSLTASKTKVSHGLKSYVQLGHVVIWQCSVLLSHTLFYLLSVMIQCSNVVIMHTL